MLRKLFNANGGAAAAEFAMILPLSLLLLFTALEAGHYFYSQHQLVKGLRDGARYGARHPASDFGADCTNPSSKATVTNSLAADIRAVALTGRITGGSEIRSGWDVSDVTFTVEIECLDPSTTPEAAAGIFADGELAPRLTLTASIGYNSLFNGMGVITDGYNLNGTQRAVVMGI